MLTRPPCDRHRLFTSVAHAPGTYFGYPRYSCPALEAGGPSSRTEPSDLDERAGNRTFYFSGESISEGHAREFVCALGLNHTVPPPSPGWACWARHAAAAARPRVCVFLVGQAVSRRAAGFLVGEASHPFLERGDVIIFNQGTMLRCTNCGAELDLELAPASNNSELSQLREQVVADGSLGRRLRARGVHLVWRETPAQHFDTPSGAYPQGRLTRYSPRGRNCVPVRNATFVRERQREVNELLVRTMGMLVLPWLEASLTGAPMASNYGACALRGRTVGASHSQCTALDCFHLCEPSPAMDALVDATFRLVRSLPRDVDPDAHLLQSIR